MKSLIRTTSLLATVCIASPANSATTAYDSAAKVPAESAIMAIEIEAYMSLDLKAPENHEENRLFSGFEMPVGSTGSLQATARLEDSYSAQDLQAANLITVPLSATFPMLLGGYLGIAFVGRKRP